VKDDRLHVGHILKCIGRIEGYCQGGREVFLSTELVQDGVLRNLQTLAESTKRLSEQTKSRFPGIDWRAVSGFRNVLVHDYLGIDLERIWEIVSKHLPVLRHLPVLQSLPLMHEEPP